MSRLIDVIAVFNTVKDVKPLYYTLDGNKYKIDKVVSKIDFHNIITFHCMVGGELTTLIFDVEKKQWTVD